MLKPFFSQKTDMSYLIYVDIFNVTCLEKLGMQLQVTVAIYPIKKRITVITLKRFRADITLISP